MPPSERMPITHGISGALRLPELPPPSPAVASGETTAFTRAGAAWPFGAREKVLARCPLRLTDS